MPHPHPLPSFSLIKTASNPDSKNNTGKFRRGRIRFRWDLFVTFEPAQPLQTPKQRYQIKSELYFLGFSSRLVSLFLSLSRPVLGDSLCLTLCFSDANLGRPMGMFTCTLLTSLDPSWDALLKNRSSTLVLNQVLKKLSQDCHQDRLLGRPSCNIFLLWDIRQERFLKIQTFFYWEGA